MNSGWIALHRSDETAELLDRYPDAVLLLTLIAYRARWKRPLIPDGLNFGEALIGKNDFERWGKNWTERRYRSAKKVLQSAGLVTFRATNKGTIATLLNAKVFSLTHDHRDEQNATLSTDQRRTSGEQPTSKRRLTNKGNKDNKENKGEIPSREQVLAQVGSVPYPLTKECADAYCVDRTADGWVSRNGLLISDWRGDLQRYARHWKNHEQKSNRNPNAVSRYVGTTPEKTLNLDGDRS